MFLPSIISTSRRRSSNAFSVSIGTGSFTTGTELTATVNGLTGGETVTYQWTDDGVDITGVTAATYTAAIGTDSVADASLIGVTITVDGGDPFNSPTRQIRYAAGSVTESTLSDITIDDDPVDIDFASDFTTTNLTGSFVITGLPTGIVDDEDGTVSGTATGSPGSFTPQVVFTDQYGRTITGNYVQDTVYRAQATGGAPLTLSFTETSGGTQDLLANWTTNGNTLTLVSVSPALPTDVEISDAGSLTVPDGLPIAADDTYTLTMVDEYGRETSDTFTLEITQGTIAVDPFVSSPSYTASSGGAPASITVPGSYTGGDTLTLYGVIGTEAIIVTEAQLIAGSGGTNTSEFFSVSDFSFADGSFGLSGLTDETADAVVFVVVEDNNGGSSGLIFSITGITGLDFTDPSFSSAEVGTVDADTLVIDASEALFDVSATTLDPAAFTLTGNTITGVSIVGGDIRLTLGTTVTSGDDYTGDLSYVSDGEIVDIAGNALPSFTSQNVTNNVAAAPSTVMPAFVASYGPSQASNVYTQAGLALGAGEFVIGIAYQTAGSAQTVTSMVVDGQTLTAEVAANDLNVSGVALYRVTTTSSSWDIVLTMSGALAQGVRFYVWGAGSGTAVVATNSSSGLDDLDPPINQNINTETGGKVIGIASVLSITDYDNLTGAALVEPAIDIDNNDLVAAFEASVTTGETPRTVSIGGTGGVRHAIATLSIGAAP
jgi:hypothetical protein